MDSAKVFSVISLASATTVASFMALMIIRGTMPIIQMAPFIGLNGAIVGGLFYLGVDAMTSFSGRSEPKLVMVRDEISKQKADQQLNPSAYLAKKPLKRNTLMSLSKRNH